MYESITYEQLLNQMLAVALAKNPGLDTREGSPLWYGQAPAAVEGQNLFIQLDTILNETFADTATRPYLILRARERGLNPHEPTKAVVKGVFTPASVILQAGTRFSLNELNYTVLEAIDGEPGAYKLECETAGEKGNEYVGTLIPIEYVKDLETAQLTEILIPGEDEQETEDFRQEYFDSFEAQAFGGNVADYKQKVNAINGVGGVKVYREWNGDISPSSLLPPGGFKAWFSALGGETPADVKKWLEIVATAATDGLLTVGGTVRLVIIDSTFSKPSDLLVETVQTAIDPITNHGDGLGLAPIGHVVTVKGVESTPINATSQFTFQTGWAWADVKPYAESAIDEYLLGLSKAWAGQNDPLVVRISGIETTLLTCPGVVDVTGTTINGKAENLILGADNIPVRGEVNG